MGRKIVRIECKQDMEELKWWVWLFIGKLPKFFETVYSNMAMAEGQMLADDNERVEVGYTV